MNIDIRNTELENLIKELEKDNLNIYNRVHNMILSYKKLDGDRWKSTEKVKLDNIMNQMMSDIENKLLLSLNECTNLLRKASNLYTETDTTLENDLRS